MKALKRICAGLIAGVLLVSSAAAADVDVLQDTRPTVNSDGQYTVTFKNAALIDGNQYALLIAKTTETLPEAGSGVATFTAPSIDVSTLTYIDQVAAANGEVTFANFIPKSVPDSVVLLGGVFNGKTSPIVIGYIDAKGVFVSIDISVSGPASDFILSGVQVKLFDDKAAEVQTAAKDADSYLASSVAAGTYYVKPVKKYCVSVPVKVVVGEEDVDSIANQIVPGDVDESGSITILDLNKILIDYNKIESFTESSDIDGSGGVTILDLNYILANFNRTDVSVADFIAAE